MRDETKTKECVMSKRGNCGIKNLYDQADSDSGDAWKNENKRL